MAGTVATLTGARRALLALAGSAALALAVLAALGLLTGSGRGGTLPAMQSAGTSTAIPAQARAAISATLGAAQKAFHVRDTGTSMEASNPRQGLSADFTRAGTELRARGLELNLSLRSLGFGEAAQHTVAQASPTADLNRVTYARGAVREWYVNGPAGLEQGFTIARAPAAEPGAPAAPLTVGLALAANASPRLTGNGSGMTLTRGAAKLDYGELQSTDAKGRALRTWLELLPASSEGRARLLIEVDAAGASYPVRIDPLVKASAKVLATDESGEGLMGTSVALSADGSTLLVGGPQDANPDRGAAWVFVHEGDSWVQQGPKLTGTEMSSEAGEEECAEESPEEAGECAFGNSVALSADGNTALIGEPSSTNRAGNAWIFTRSGTTWTRAAVLAAGAGPNEGRFGKSVALSADGTTALVGDPSATGQRGSAWFFAKGGSGWALQQMLGDPEAEHLDHFGRSVALSADGNTALIGAPGVGHYTGAADVFTRAGTSWSQLGGQLKGAGETGEGRFGKSVALSGDGQTALVGAMNDAEGEGAVWPFARGAGGFAAQGAVLKPEAPGPGHFGASLALAGNGREGLAGIPHAPEGGAVAQLVRSGSEWEVLPSQLVGPERAGKGAIGSAVALSSDASTGAAGAPRDNARVGAAWVFDELPGPPSVANVTPGSGPVGTTVKVRGLNLSEPTGVFFGGTPAASFVGKSNDVIEAVAPEGLGTVDVTVRTAFGTSEVDKEQDTFRYTTGKAKGGGSGNEEPGGGPGGENPGGDGNQSGSGQSGNQSSNAGSGSKSPSGGVLGTTSTGAASSSGCVLRLRSKRLAVTGYRTVALRLQRTGAGACSGKLTLSFNRSKHGKKPKLQTIGTASFAMGSASTKVLKIDLNKLGRKLFRGHAGKLNASLSFVRSVPAPRLARSASVRLSVKKTKKVTLGK